MQHYMLDGWQGMEKIGFSVLTGERDNTLTRRMLVDMSAQGAEILRELMDLPKIGGGGMPFNSNWNSRVGDAPAVYSAMIPADWWSEIAVFGLLSLGLPYVYATPSRVWSDDGATWDGIDTAWSAAKDSALKTKQEGDPDFYALWKKGVPDYILEINRWRGLASRTLNQVHAMSGRK